MENHSTKKSRTGRWRLHITRRRRRRNNGLSWYCRSSRILWRFFVRDPEIIIATSSTAATTSTTLLASATIRAWEIWAFVGIMALLVTTIAFYIWKLIGRIVKGTLVGITTIVTRTLFSSAFIQFVEELAPRFRKGWSGNTKNNSNYKS
jgi:hypothetical protein